MKIRIKNIECRPCNGTYDFELIKWQPCMYYGKKEQYLNDGYIEEGGYLSRNNSNIDLSFFDTKEICYVLAWLKFNSESSLELKTVGIRPLQLKMKELKDFLKIWRIFSDNV